MANKGIPQLLNEAANVIENNADSLREASQHNGRFLFKEDERIYNREMKLVRELREKADELTDTNGNTGE